MFAFEYFYYLVSEQIAKHTFHIVTPTTYQVQNDENIDLDETVVSRILKSSFLQTILKFNVGRHQEQQQQQLPDLLILQYHQQLHRQQHHQEQAIHVLISVGPIRMM